MIMDMMLHRTSGLTLRHVMEAKYGAPVYSLHPPMVATFPDMPLDNSPEYHDISITDWQMICLILAYAIQTVARVYLELSAISDCCAQQCNTVSTFS